MPLRVLVSGGAGFIGSHVCDLLLASGCEVDVLDDLSSGKRENLDPRARLHVADLRSAEAASLVERLRPDAICHLAAQISVHRSVQDPRFDAECNILGLLNLLEASRRAGVRRFVFSSTGGALYGDPDTHPAPETHAVRPAAPYGCSKAAGEIYLGYYRAQHGMSCVALRYANVYGPRQNPHGEAGVVAIFSERLLRGQRCDIYGTGKQTRDFVFVGDVARANALALGSDFNGAVNIGSGIESDIATIYALLAREAGTHAAPRHLPAKAGEPMRSSIDPALAARTIGWRPSVPLAEGLKQTFAWFAGRAALDNAA